MITMSESTVRGPSCWDFMIRSASTSSSVSERAPPASETFERDLDLRRFEHQTTISSLDVRSRVQNLDETTETRATASHRWYRRTLDGLEELMTSGGGSQGERDSRSGMFVVSWCRHGRGGLDSPLLTSTIAGTRAVLS